MEAAAKKVGASAGMACASKDSTVENLPGEEWRHRRMPSRSQINGNNSRKHGAFRLGIVEWLEFKRRVTARWLRESAPMHGFQTGCAG